MNFSIVSQVNPHVNLFFFSSRGAVGRPVTHRKGRGWRGGYLGSATETYLKVGNPLHYFTNSSWSRSLNVPWELFHYICAFEDLIDCIGVAVLT